ncbi:MAG: diguanylate cyclase [Pseudomonadota bacterium]
MQHQKSTFAEARVIASRALDLAQRHRTPPFPRAYEVWFTYASGTNEGLCARLDLAIADGQEIGAALIEELYASYLSPDALNAGVERIGDRVQSELGEVIDMIETGVDGGEALAAAIKSAEETLARSKDPMEQARALERLRGEHRRHHRATAKLGENLGTMRAQFLAMQQELRDLRQSVLLDAVTQLPNVGFFPDAAARLLSDGIPYGQGEFCSCLMLIDIDTLSDIRRACGRAVADGVLAQVAELLRRVLGDEGDVAIRLESDRFALLLRARRPDGIAPLVDGLERAFAAIRLHRSGGRADELRVMSVVGAARLESRDTAERLVERAEQSQVQRRASRAAA